MGVEVEYGVTVQGQPLANHMVASSQVVNAYASATVKARLRRYLRLLRPERSGRFFRLFLRIRRRMQRA